MTFILSCLICFSLLSQAYRVTGQLLELGSCDKAHLLSDFDKNACQKALPFDETGSGCQGSDTCCKQVQWYTSHSCHCLAIPNSQTLSRLKEELDRCSTLNEGSRGDPVTGEAERGEDDGIKLFVGVLTAAKNVHAREAIRKTWGADPSLHRVLFFSAKPSDDLVFSILRTEATTHKDVVLLPTIWESYHNITHQTLEVLRFAAADNLATHVLKVDDDSYVRVDLLLERIRSAPNSCLFLGAIENPGGGPHRNPRSAWYVTKEEWASEVYPPWAHGAGYVISQDLVGEIAAGAALISSGHNLFKLEDISVGAWVEFVGKEKKWHINYVSDSAFNYNGCEPYDIVSHYIRPRAMHCMFKKQGFCCYKPRPQSRIRGGD